MSKVNNELRTIFDANGILSYGQHLLPSSDEPYKFLFDTLNVGIFLSSLDGQFLYVNSALAELAGYGDVYELMQQKTQNLYAHEQDRTALIDEIQSHGSVKDRELLLKKKDGSECWISLSISLVRDAAGKPKALLGSVLDITTRRQVEQELHQNRGYFQSLFSNMAEGVALHEMILDEQGRAVDYRIVEVNQRYEEILGKHREDVIGKISTEAYGVSVPPYLNEFCGVGLSRKAARLETYFPAMDRHFDISIAPWGDSGFATIFTDISPRKHLEEDLRQAQRVESLGHLSASVAHDFNNLLGPIMGYAELLLGEMSPQEKRFDQVKEILRATMRARDLTRHLLAFGRKQALQVRDLDLSEVVLGMHKLLRRALRENIDLSLDLSDQPVFVSVDANQMGQILMNLVVNAQDAMPQGGKLTIRVNRHTKNEQSPGFKLGKDDCAVLMVSDTGCGIDEQARAHVFEPFFSTKGERGTGLGLATVYGIVKQHGGEIELKSQLGQGTTFFVYLPILSQVHGLEIPTIMVTQEKKESTIVLVVEDNEMVCDLTMTILARFGYQTLSASNAALALDIIKDERQKIDLLLTDIVLPHMNGYSLYDAARLIRPDLRAVFMSGYTNEATGLDGFLEMGGHFLQKPFTVDDLLGCINTALSQE